MKNIVINLVLVWIISSYEKSIYLKLIAQVLAREAYVSCPFTGKVQKQLS